MKKNNSRNLAKCRLLLVEVEVLLKRSFKKKNFDERLRNKNFFNLMFSNREGAHGC